MPGVFFPQTGQIFMGHAAILADRLIEQHFQDASFGGAGEGLGGLLDSNADVH